MTWLLEEPLPILLMGAVVVIGLTVGFIKTGQRSILYSLLAAVVITAGLFLLERFVVTDREQVEQVLYTIADAIERNDIDEALQHISPRAPGLEHARRELPQFTFHEVNIKPNLEIDLLPEQNPTTANARFNVVVELSHPGVGLSHSRYPRYVEVTLEKQGGRWMVRDYGHYEPTRGMRTGPAGEESYGY